VEELSVALENLQV
jgi:hypothetical protein